MQRVGALLAIDTEGRLHPRALSLNGHRHDIDSIEDCQFDVNPRPQWLFQVRIEGERWTLALRVTQAHLEALATVPDHPEGTL